MAKMSRTQMRIQQLTGSFGNVDGKIQDQLTIKGTKAAIVAQDLSGSLSYMAAAIRRIHGNADFSNSATGEFSVDITPASNSGADLGSAAKGWDDLFLGDDGVIQLGDDQDVTLTHVPDTGVLLNSTMAIQFNDASQYIKGSSATELEIGATDQINLESTLVDLNGNLDVSGNAIVAGQLDVNGTVDMDITSYANTIAGAGEITVSDTNAFQIANAAKTTFLKLTAHSDAANEKIGIKNNDGTAADSISMWSPNGGIFLNVDSTGKKIHLDSEAIVDIDGGEGVTIDGGAASNFTTSAGKLTLIGAGGEDVGTSGAMTTFKGTVNVDEEATFDANVTIAGNLDVNGTTTTIDTANLTVQDSIIALGVSGSGAYTNVGDRGILFPIGANSSVATNALWFDGSQFNLAVSKTGPTSGSFESIDSYSDLHVGDVVIKQDAGTLKFGADNDVTLTHVADTGLLLNGDMQLQFNDGSQFINAPSATVLDINATAEIELNAAEIDINGDAKVSGDLWLDGSNKELRFYEAGNYVGFEAPALSADQIWVLPDADGTADQALKTDGNGNLSWKSFISAEVFKKAQVQLTAPLAAGQRLDSATPPVSCESLLPDTFDLFNRSEVYVNGQLLMSGSEASRVANPPTVDYHMELIPLAGATVQFGVADGDAANGMSAGQKISITSADQTKKEYIITDTANGGGATGSVVNNTTKLGESGGSDITLTTLSATLATGFTGVAIGLELLNGLTTQNVFLVQLKAAIEHANGHNSKITVGAVPGQANGNQQITLTQQQQGTSGNTAGTHNITNAIVNGASNANVVFANGTEQGISPKLSFDLEADDVVTIVSR